MASDPQDSASDQSGRLPFEPVRKKAAKKQKPASSDAPKAKPQPSEPSVKVEKKAKSAAKPLSQKSRESTAIPEVVSKRMARRMAVLCGVPTTLGMATFVVSYIIVTKGIFKLPNVAVILVSMGFFGLGVLGLSYGLLSASWDEERSGSLVGWSEFTTNLSRLGDAWKAARQQKIDG